MNHLNIQPNLGVPGERYRHAYMPGDRFYEMLIEGHRGLSDEQSELMNARLVLLLANHVGDLRVLHEAITVARGGVEKGSVARGDVEKGSVARGDVEKDSVARGGVAKE
ncbi:MAG: DUF2783 domain-containing protein [Burkholderiales bacterium]|nr:DUF2783 domain-containing protein [Burkholderiales bacterium]